MLPKVEGQVKLMKGNGEAFNTAGSSSIGQVDSKKVVNGQHRRPMKGEANSVTQSYADGKLVQERYYDSNGNAYLDIDYSDHGNSKTHPTVPHQHHIKCINGKPRRGRDEEVK